MAKKKYEVTMVVECEEGAQNYIADSVCDGLEEPTCVTYINVKEINTKLWIIEDDKRQCEKDKDFGEKFIKLSRDVHFLNDDRAKIKLEINNHTGSVIKEIKEYTSY